MAKASKIVAAVGAAANAKDIGLATRIEAAMSEALVKAMANGVTDPDEQRAVMLAARDKARAA